MEQIDTDCPACEDRYDCVVGLPNPCRLKYTILRRALQHGKVGENGKPDKKYTVEYLVELIGEMEGRTFEELTQIHREWIGY